MPTTDFLFSRHIVAFMMFEFVDYIDVTKQVDLFYHVEFEGRDCVLVQAFVMSLDDSSWVWFWLKLWFKSHWHFWKIWRLSSKSWVVGWCSEWTSGKWEIDNSAILVVIGDNWWGLCRIRFEYIGLLYLQKCIRLYRCTVIFALILA